MSHHILPYSVSRAMQPLYALVMYLMFVIVRRQKPGQTTGCVGRVDDVGSILPGVDHLLLKSVFLCVACNVSVVDDESQSDRSDPWGDATVEESNLLGMSILDCRPDARCNAGEGDCDRSTDCALGLVCRYNVGNNYGLPFSVDVCELPGNGDFNYCSVDAPCNLGEGDCDSSRECAAGLVCVYDVGSNYGWPSAVDVCELSSNGDFNYCSADAPCNAGEGDCDSSRECAAGLVCAYDVGSNYGWPSTVDVCEASNADGLWLVDADSDTDVRAIVNGETLSINQLPANWTLRSAHTSTPGQVCFYLNDDFERCESVAPFSISGDTDGDYEPYNLASGSYIVEVEVDGNLAFTRSFTVTGELWLVDADSDTDVRAIVSGETLYTDQLPANWTLRSVHASTPGQVCFYLNDDFERCESVAPFSISGDADGDYAPYNLGNGTYSVELRTDGSLSSTTTFTVASGSPPGR